MSRLNVMDYTADFLRGWPNEGALESSTYTIASGQELEAGDLVILNATGELVKTAAETNFAGIVVRGNIDDKSVAGPTGGNLAVAPNKAIVVWGGYIVRTTKIEATVMGGAPMDAVVASASGTFVRAADSTTLAADGVTLAYTEPHASVLGYVLELVTGQNGAPDSAVIVVK